MERRNWSEVNRNITLLIPKYGKSISASELNGYAYSMFLSCTDERYLMDALKWTDILISTENDNTTRFTRASLLYKLGRAKEAMELMKLGIASSAQEDLGGMNEVLKMMQDGKKIWLEN